MKRRLVTYQKLERELFEWRAIAIVAILLLAVATAHLIGGGCAP